MSRRSSAADRRESGYARSRTGLVEGEEWLAVLGFRQAVGAEYTHCWNGYYVNRAFASVGRLLQRHTGPVFPLFEDLFGREHR